MANRSKAKGSGFESQGVSFLRERLGQEQIERRALHGSKDMGDIFGLRAHGREGVVECKSYKRYGPADVERWRRQTIDERENAGADFALLVIHQPGCGRTRFGLNRCDMQLRDLDVMSGDGFTCLMGDSMRDVWVTMTVEEACRIIEA